MACRRGEKGYDLREYLKHKTRRSAGFVYLGVETGNEVFVLGQLSDRDGGRAKEVFSGEKNLRCPKQMPNYNPPVSSITDPPTFTVALAFALPEVTVKIVVLSGETLIEPDAAVC